MQRMRVILILILAAVWLVACGGASTPPGEAMGEDDTSSAGAATATAGPERVAPQAEPVTKATSIKIVATPTPVPPPPTRTPAPSPTPAPTLEAASSQEPGEEPEEEQIALRGSEMVEIPAGLYVMGNDESDPNEAPAHEVDLPAYEIDKFEVTNADFEAFVEDGGYVTYAETQEGSPSWRDEFVAGEENHPVVRVTFDDALAYCAWAGKRLPTEQEWEKAARGPDAFLYPWGNNWDSGQANVKESGIRDTVDVGSYPANGYGLFDTAGNVWEWTDAPYVAYPGSTHQDSQYSPDLRVTRGGGWFDTEEQVRATNRSAAPPDITANDDVGFRCAK
ncbi:MAG: formylglycine-generating enzyme family protein [Anaerolineales bacterium]|nr:MAG: formylglycine-generating enzyme family protein [Anaerolineales bacterium]